MNAKIISCNKMEFYAFCLLTKLFFQSMRMVVVQRLDYKLNCELYDIGKILLLSQSQWKRSVERTAQWYWKVQTTEAANVLSVSFVFISSLSLIDANCECFGGRVSSNRFFFCFVCFASLGGRRFCPTKSKLMIVMTRTTHCLHCNSIDFCMYFCRLM